MHRGFIYGALFLLPSVALATGFAQDSLFLSKDSVTEGESVLIHSVVRNEAATTFAGTLVVSDGETKVGSLPITLKAGEADTVSVSWKPSAGTHKVVAQLQDKDGEVVANESETFSIKAKPKPVVEKKSDQPAAAVESSDGIQSQIGSLSPVVEEKTAPFFTLVDGGRQAMADVLDAQIASVKPKVASAPLPGMVAGAETIKAPEEQSWFWSIIYTVYFYILTVVRFVIGSAGIFYPLLALVFFWGLWRTYRRFRRA